MTKGYVSDPLYGKEYVVICGACGYEVPKTTPASFFCSCGACARWTTKSLVPAQTYDEGEPALDDPNRVLR